MNALAIVPARSLPSPAEIVSMFLTGRNESTRRSYAMDMRYFAKFLGAEDSNVAAQSFLMHGHGNANRLGLEYRNAMNARGLSPATINRRLSTLRSLTKLARMVGVINWRIEIENVKGGGSYRDTRGPTRAGFRRIVGQSETRSDPKGLRDRAVVFLLHDLALRCGEVVSLDKEDLNLQEQSIMVKGKGKSEKVRMSLPDRTCAALSIWVDVRGKDPGPLFYGFTINNKMLSERLKSSGIWWMIKKLGEDTGQRVSPHGLRHTAITTAVERAAAEGIDLSKVQQFSRHANLKTLQIYVDNHEDYQGRVARMVAR